MSITTSPDFQLQLTRRAFLRGSAFGIGALGLASLLQKKLGASVPTSTPGGVLHYAPKAKRIIFLFMSGGPSQIDLFDPKPKLNELNGQPMPESLVKNERVAQLQGQPLLCMGRGYKFARYGQAGVDISELLPWTAKMAGDITVIRSMQTAQINHDTAHPFMNTGSIIKGRPSMGSWLLYGLGSDTAELPGFIVLTSSGKYGPQPISARQWSSGVLPSRFQGIQFQSRGDAVHYIGNPDGVCQSTQRQVIDEIQRMNGLLADETIDPEIATRIAQYEMAFKMQSSVPDLMDFTGESQAMLDLYGVKEPGDGSFASNCLLARRLAERGVRMIQLYHRAWDHHSNLEEGMKEGALAVDKASAALIKDLKQRGLLEDTLILWGGEFGRTPMGQGTGRDHHIHDPPVCARLIQQLLPQDSLALF